MSVDPTALSDAQTTYVLDRVRDGQHNASENDVLDLIAPKLKEGVSGIANSSTAQHLPCGCHRNSRNLVVCIDGTSNQFGKMNTNVIELYSLIPKGSDDRQRTYYNSGIGTYARPSWKSWAWYKQVLGHKLDLAIAWNFERIVLDAYRWLSETHEDGDCIFLFGFSRGAYQVRTLSAMIENVGLIHRGNEAQIPFAYQLYADIGRAHSDTTKDAELFKKTFSRDVKIHFVGAWDTVSSIGIVRSRKLLPGTIDGMKHVCYFRHALALDERRVKFLPEYAYGGSTLPSDPESESQTTFHDTKEVWFAGTHSDIGGGNEVNEKLDHTRPSLRWMFSEALTTGLRLISFERTYRDEEEITINESLSMWWEPFERLPFRRLAYSSAKNNEHFAEDGWILLEIIFWLLWTLVEFPALAWHALKYVAHSPSKDVRRGMTPNKQEKRTVSWPPHRGKGRIIQVGQKIHPSVWRLKNLGATASGYTPRACPPEEGFWAHVSQHEDLKPDGTYENPWKGVDFYDLAEDLVVQYTRHKLAVQNDEGQRAQLHMLRIHAASVDGRRAQLRALTRQLKDEVVQADIFRNILNVLIDSADPRAELKVDLPYESIQAQMSRHLYGADVYQSRIAANVLAVCVEGARAGRVLTDHLAPVTSVAFSPDGQFIASASQDQTMRVWNVKTGSAAGKPLKWNDHNVHCVAFSPDSKHVVSAAEGDVALRVWDAKTGQEIWKHSEDTICYFSVAFSPDGKHVVSGSSDYAVEIWDAKTGLHVGEPLRGHTDVVRSVAFSPNGTHVVSGSCDNTVRVWDVMERQMVGHQLEGHSDDVERVAFFPDNRRVISGSRDGTIRIWDTETASMMREPYKVDSTCVALSSDGKYIVSGTWDHTIRIWHVETGVVRRPYEGHTRKINCVAFSPDGKRVVSASADHTVQIWHILGPLQPPEMTEVHEDDVEVVAGNLVSPFRDPSPSQ